MSDLTCLTVQEAADYMQVSERTLREAIARGEFPPARRIGRRIVIPRRALVAWLDGQDDETNVVPLRAG